MFPSFKAQVKHKTALQFCLSYPTFRHNCGQHHPNLKLLHVARNFNSRQNSPYLQQKRAKYSAALQFSASSGMSIVIGDFRSGPV
jgi:hypothetical protein